MNRNSFIKYLFIALITLGHISCAQKNELSHTLQSPKSDKLRVFVIGNSFSQNATKFLPEIAKEAGKTLEIGRAELGGCPLQRHWEVAAAYEADPKDPKGLEYRGKSLKMLLSDGVWDVVTLQQYSLLSGDESSYEPYVTNLYNYIKKIQPNAKIVFHQTWAYRKDKEVFGKIGPGQNAKTAKEMWQKSRAAYHKVADKFNTKVIPVGDAFWEITADPEWTFKKDASIDTNKFVYPNVINEPSSLNVGYKWDDNKKVVVDYNHASTTGCYLGGLVWYGFLFNEDPTKVKFKPEEVSEEFAERLKIAAKDVLK